MIHHRSATARVRPVAARQRLLPAVLAFPVISAVSAPSPSGAPLSSPPPLPPQPVHAGAANCNPQQQTRNGWTLLADAAGASDYPSFAIAVDPWLPCRMYRASDAQSLDRSVDGGRTWHRVFEDSARAVDTPAGDPTCATAGCTLSTPPFTASALALPADGTVLMGEHGNGDALVASEDAGSAWRLANGGPNGVAGEHVTLLSVAPSDPQTMYVAVDSSTGGPPHLFVTTDGGISWSSRVLPLPMGAVVSLQVDPGIPMRVWAAIDLRAGWLVLETRDGGTTWQSDARSLTGTESIRQLLATRSSRHGLRLYATVVNAVDQQACNGTGCTGGANPGLEISDDGGVGFRTTSVPAGAGTWPMLASDPAAADTLLYVNALAANTVVSTVPRAVAGGSTTPADSPLVVVSTTDGFDHLSAATAPLSAVRPGPSPYGRTVLAPGLSGAPPLDELSLQADSGGSFYLSLATDCTADTPGCRGMVGHRHTVWRYAPPVASGMPAPPPLPPPAAAASPLVGLAPCPIPTADPDPLHASGSLTYDGLDLLYSQGFETAPQPYTALIHEMDPRTCRSRGVITVHFTPALLQAIGGTDHPSLDSFTYDPHRNVIWTWLVDQRSPGTAHLLTVGPADFTLPSVDVTAALPSHSSAAPCGGQAPAITYEYAADSLWTACDYGGNFRRTGVATGASLPTCMGSVFGGLGGTVTGLATFTFGMAGRLWVQQEDDTTIAAFDTLTCRRDAVYVHRTFSEPYMENEQLACDPVSFGPDAVTGTAAPASVLWLRDAEAHEATPYLIPGEYCPLPSITRLTVPSTVAAGATLRPCAALASMGLDLPLARRAIDFSVDGTDSGMAVTDAHGMACLGHEVGPLQPARSHDVLARFAGDAAYLPSQGPGVVSVQGIAGLIRDHPVANRGAVVATGAGGGLPPLAVTEPSVVQAPRLEVVGQGEVQAQAQVQVQSNTQAQSSAQTQVGAVPQVSRQRQVAVQSAHLPPVAVMEARRTRVAIVGRSEAAAGMLAAAVVWLAWCLRRRRLAAAPAARGRRDGMPATFRRSGS